MNLSNSRVGKDFGNPLHEFPHLADKETEVQRGINQRIHSFSAESTCFVSLHVIRNRVHF